MRSPQHWAILPHFSCRFILPVSSTVISLSNYHPFWHPHHQHHPHSQTTLSPKRKMETITQQLLVIRLTSVPIFSFSPPVATCSLLSSKVNCSTWALNTPSYLLRLTESIILFLSLVYSGNFSLSSRSFPSSILTFNTLHFKLTCLWLVPDFFASFTGKIKIVLIGYLHFFISHSFLNPFQSGWLRHSLKQLQCRSTMISLLPKHKNYFFILYLLTMLVTVFGNVDKFSPWNTPYFGLNSQCSPSYCHGSLLFAGLSSFTCSLGFELLKAGT